MRDHEQSFFAHDILNIGKDGFIMVKTNVMRLLEQAGIPYRAMEYEVDENNLGGSMSPS